MQRAFANAARAVRLFRYRHLFTHGVTACLLLACALAHAQVTPLNWYRLGEFDGTAVGQPATAATDTVGAKPLTMTGSPLVASDVGASAASAVGSTRSLQFPGGNGDYAYYQQPTKVTDNFGMEVWVKPLAASANDQVIVYNGRFGTDGFGIVLKSDGKYYGQFGLPTFGGVTAALNTWVHLAIVRDNGSATLFVNGVAAANSTGLAPTAPPTNGGFTIGNGGPSFVTGLQGLVDEVRLFTLSPGNFDPNMLLFSAKLVTSTANNGAGTLRSQLNAAPKAGTVVISATGTIAIDGPLAIVNRGVYLYGPGVANLSLSGTSPNPTRAFFIDTQDTVGISDLTIANGVATGGAGGNGSWAGGGGMGAGGGIFANAGNVVLTRVNFAGNSATGGKGGNTNGSACGCMGGGGGLGGAGGSSTALGSAGGGGGWLGAGGGVPRRRIIPAVAAVAALLAWAERPVLRPAAAAARTTPELTRAISPVARAPMAWAASEGHSIQAHRTTAVTDWTSAAAAVPRKTETAATVETMPAVAAQASESAAPAVTSAAAAAAPSAFRCPVVLVAAAAAKARSTRATAASVGARVAAIPAAAARQAHSVATVA